MVNFRRAKDMGTTFTLIRLLWQHFLMFRSWDSLGFLMCNCLGPVLLKTMKKSHVAICSTPFVRLTRLLVAMLIWTLWTLFPLIISENTWWISTNFHTHVRWRGAPTPGDFLTGPTTGLPPSGNLNLKFADLLSDDYFGKYLVEINQNLHRCS